MNTITIEDMQRDLQGYLREVREGSSLVILDADRPVAELKPFTDTGGQASKAGLSEDDAELSRLEAEVDRLYGEIRDLMARATDEPQRDRTLLEEIERRRASLRRVQEREAEIRDRRAAARLRFDPTDGKKLLARAAKLLER